MTETMSTHWDDCWKQLGHRKCAEARKRALWNQYLSDGSNETWDRYKEVKWFLEIGGISF